MASCRLLLAAGTSRDSSLNGWRFSVNYEVREVQLDRLFVVVQLFPSNQMIKFSLDDEAVYSILTCTHRYITTFRFNQGTFAKIEGSCQLSASFSVGESEFFDITLSNQSQYFAKLFSLADARLADHDESMAIKLMKQFPLEDQGMVLIHGPLPSNESLAATSYPAWDVFDMKNFKSLKIDAQTGLGLVIKVEGNEVSVQYGNAVVTLERGALSGYSVYSTGLPTAVPEVTPNTLENSSEISDDDNEGESIWFEPALFSSMT
jgi:hypothetical protein